MLLALLLTLATAFGAVRASSELAEAGGKRTAALAFDGLLKTSWAEGSPGSGEGQWIELDLGRVVDFRSISVWPGDLAEGARSFRERSRPRRLQVHADDRPLGESVYIEDGLARIDIPLAGRARKIRIEVVEVYEGMVFSDLAIAEIALDWPDATTSARLEAWRAGKEGIKAQEAWLARVEEAYAAHKGAQFGDEAAFALLCDAVADGAPFLRERARALVPDGYRAQALRSDAKAQEAVRKLRDPNGIPAFELALLRAQGEEARRLQDVVEIFQAYQELIGGGNRNVPYWGQSGWEPGAMRGFGEPLPIALDATGQVYLADTGNNRVQVFADNGRPLKSWGGEPDITDAWFAEGRKWYVSGAAPGTDAGRYFNPLDVEVIPGKEGDRIAVLDASGRVQILDTDGKPVISWTVQTKNEARPALGGTAYLVWVPQKERLYAIIEDDAMGYTLDAAEVVRWKIRDGTPKAAALGNGGKIYFAFGYEIVAYDPDGFRYGSVLPKGQLGQGFEDLDLTLDEDGRLWVVTDTGWAWRYKRPGKVEFKVRLFSRPIAHPRIAVRDGLVHVSTDDRIEVIDAFQKRLDAEHKEKDEAASELDEL